MYTIKYIIILFINIHNNYCKAYVNKRIVIMMIHGYTYNDDHSIPEEVEASTIALKKIIT